MNIQFSDWQLVDLSSFSSTISSSFNNIEGTFSALDPNALIVYSESNSRLSGNWSGYSFVMTGSNFYYNLSTINALSLTNGDQSFQFSGKVTYNYNFDSYGGYFNKFTYIDRTPDVGDISKIELIGKFNLDPFGELSSGIVNSYTINVDGYMANFAGNLTLDVNGNVVGGTVSAFTFADAAGHKLSATGLSLSAINFDELTDPANHSNLNDLYALLSDPSKLAGNDTITADDNANSIYGYAGADTLVGRAGNDTLDGGSGIDKLIGGDGNDTYLVDLVQAGTTAANYRLLLQDSITEAATLNGGTQDTVILRSGVVMPIQSQNLASTITLGANIENLDASNTGSAYLNLTGNILNNTLTGNDANNILDGNKGADVMIGGAGNDTYFVDNIGDIVDESTGSGNADLVKVAIVAANGNYTLTDGIENGTLINTVAFTLTGNNLDNTLTGNGSANTLNGGFGDDILDGKAGADVLAGGSNNDIYFVDNKGDVVIESANEGIDTIKSSISFDLNLNGNNVENLTLTGNAVINATGNSLNNMLTGNAAANFLDGKDGGDVLMGGAGNDRLSGGLDNDTLVGGTGNDLLTGGLGADIFVWSLADKGSNGHPSVDKITDFNLSENDVLDIKDLLVNESSSNILNYLDITISTNAGVTSTEIRISNTGGFAGGNYTLAAENAHITIAGVNLYAETNASNESDLIQSLVSSNKLVID